MIDALRNTSAMEEKPSEVLDAGSVEQSKDILYQLARSLHNQNLSANSIRLVIKSENSQKCDPPLTDNELDELLFSVLSYDEDSNNEFSSSGGEDPIHTLEDIEREIRNDHLIYICTNKDDKKSLERVGIKAYKLESWKREYCSYFKGCRMVAFLRNDDSNSIIYEMSKDLSRIAFSRKIVETSKKAGGGVADYLQLEGNTKEDLVALIDKTECKFANWVHIEGKKMKINVGLLANEITTNNNIFVARLPGLNSDRVYWYNQGMYVGKSDSEMISEIIKYIPPAYQSATSLRNAVTLVKSNVESVDYDDLNNNERYVNLKNGLLDTDTFELIPHDPEKCGIVQLDCEWEPGAKMDRWIAFVSDLCRDAEGNVDVQMLLVLQEWMGLFLSSIHGYRVKQALVLFSPRGNTGKSVFLGVLKSILGINNIANVPFQDMGSSRWATGRAFGKRLIVVGDQSADSVGNSSVFKQLTGGDPVSAEFKGVQGFDYVYKGMIVIACNLLPAFDDDKGDHVAERLMFLPCRNVIPMEERDRFLSDALIKEKNGAFQWAMNGLKRYVKNGFKFTKCDCASELMNRYRARIDSMYVFLREECIFTECDADIIRKTDFETAYRAFCEKKEITALAQNNICNRAEALGHPLYVKDGYKVFRRLKLRNVVIDEIEQTAEKYLKDSNKYAEDRVSELRKALNCLKETYKDHSDPYSSSRDFSNIQQVDQAIDALKDAIKNLAGHYYDGFVPLDDDELIEFDDSRVK